MISAFKCCCLESCGVHIMEVCMIRWDPELSFLRPDGQRESCIEAVKDTPFLAI